MSYERICNPEIKGNDIYCKDKKGVEKLVHWRQLNQDVIKEYLEKVIVNGEEIAKINERYKDAVINAELVDVKIKRIVMIGNTPIVKKIDKDGKPVYMYEDVLTGEKEKKNIDYRFWFWENVLNYKTDNGKVIKK